MRLAPAGKRPAVHVAVARGHRGACPTHRTVRCKGLLEQLPAHGERFRHRRGTGKHRRFITGNRCEKGESFGAGWAKSDVPNLFEYKSQRLFRLLYAAF